MRLGWEKISSCIGNTYMVRINDLIRSHLICLSLLRGEVGFCSMECREERMTLDEIKEKEKLKSSRLASKAKNDVDHKLSSAKQNIISVSDVPTPVAGGKIIVPLSIA